MKEIIGNNPIEQFKKERQEDILRMSEDQKLKKLSTDWVIEASKYKYGYNFTWLGRPIIQLPTDIIALQEIIWQVKPDLIIETGIAHGGSIIFTASMLELIGGSGKVVGIDIDIRSHNRKEIENHPMMKRIEMLEGSSIDEDIVSKVSEIAKGRNKIMVLLDSCHTHDHVLKELQLYSKFVSNNSYLIVYDTSVQLFPDETFNDRPWGTKNNPMTAVKEFLTKNDNFIIDKMIEKKLLMTSCPSGYLKRTK